MYGDHEGLGAEMHDQTSAGRDREMDVGANAYDAPSDPSTTTEYTGTDYPTGPGTGTTDYTGTGTDYAASSTYASSTYAAGSATGTAGSATGTTGSTTGGAATGGGDSGGVKEKAATAATAGAQAASDGARDVAQTAKDEARQVAGEVSAQARRMADDVGSRLRDQAHQQHGTMVDRLRRASDDMREMADGRDGSPATSLVSNLAERASRFADQLESRGPEGVLTEVQEFARRRPGTFLLAAAAAGFVVGRVGKSIFTAPNNPLSGGDSDQGYRAAYGAGTADTPVGYRDAGVAGSSTDLSSTPSGTGTTGYATTDPTDLIHDDGGFEDPQPGAVPPASSMSGSVPEGGRS
jgi:hypothetical protein